MPTFIIFKNGQVLESIRGANPQALRAAVQKIVGDIAQEKAKAKPAESAPQNKDQVEEKTVSGGYSMTSGNNWRMSLS